MGIILSSIGKETRVFPDQIDLSKDLSGGHARNFLYCHNRMVQDVRTEAFRTGKLLDFNQFDKNFRRPFNYMQKRGLEVSGIVE